MTGSTLSSLENGSAGVNLVLGRALSLSLCKLPWHLGGPFALVHRDELRSECTGADLLLRFTEAGLVLEFIVKSGAHFILLPHGEGIFLGIGLPRFEEGVRLSIIPSSMHLFLFLCSTQLL